MILVIIYLIACLGLLAFASISHYIVVMPEWYLLNLMAFQSAYIGGLGGMIYCLRAVYLNKCVRNNWDSNWHTWYYLRPLTSILIGFVCYIFLKAGLLVLDASVQEDSTAYGYLAIAFISGYNVDNFMKKLEAIAESVWGIEKSRTASKD